MSVPFGRRLLAGFALLRNPAVPKLPRLAVLLALLYLLWPADVVPDFALPLVGYLDDAVLVWASLRWLLRQEPGPGAKPTPTGDEGDLSR